jgi:DNA-binding SARP family transcriptional activator/TolB-like protein
LTQEVVLMTLLHVSLLGQFHCHHADGKTLVFPTRKVAALLAYLATSPGQLHSRSKLAGLLWEAMPEAQARTNLRKTLSRLQQAMPVPIQSSLVLQGQTVGLKRNTVGVDLERYERLLADGTPETLEKALALYRGPFLEGFDDCGEAFEEWLLQQRCWLDETLQQLLHRLLDHYVECGAIDAGIQLALRLLAYDPLDEGVQRTLIRLYLYQDRIGAALAQYRSCRERLAAELGVAPAMETERLKSELIAMLPNAGPELPCEGDDLPERSSVIDAAAASRSRQRTLPSERPSLAVLAFALLDEPGAHHYLGNAMAEDLTTELGRFGEFDVIAPTSALVYRHSQAAPERIGRELGVDYLLDGMIQYRSDRLRMTVRLLAMPDARQVWAERYENPLEELLDVQDEIVSRITSTLAGHIAEDRLRQTRRNPPQDWQAYDHWLRGWHALRRPDLSAIHTARRHFKQALARDPQFARAYVGLALAHLNEWSCHSWSHWVFLQQEALELSRKAVTLDANDHRAHCMLGLAELYSGNYATAERELSLALDLNPNDTDVLAHASFSLALVGESERGVAYARKALRLAPYRPEWYAGMAGIAFFSASRYDEAIETMASAPQAFCNTPAFIAAAYAYLGQPEKGASLRDTVYRHYRYQLARGTFPDHIGCLDWLAALDPYQRPIDADHYREGLLRAGFK